MARRCHRLRHNRPPRPRGSLRWRRPNTNTHPRNRGLHTCTHTYGDRNPHTHTLTPTPAPTPEAMPSPTAPAIVEHTPMGSLRDLVINPKTVGKQLLDPLSADEVSCIKEAVGQDFYTIIQVTPIAAFGGDVSSATFLFDCLIPESIVLIGIAFLDAQAGGWTEETRQCITGVGLEHPEAVYVRMGLEWRDPAEGHATETFDYNVRIYECMTSAEKQGSPSPSGLGSTDTPKPPAATSSPSSPRPRQPAYAKTSRHSSTKPSWSPPP